MIFQPISLENWERREYFEHYFSQVPCTYSMTVKLDITPLIRAGARLYPSMLYCLAAVVNRHREFRMAFDKEGRLGFFTQVHPCYTVFHKDSETFSNLWTEYTDDYRAFCRAYRDDVEQYKDIPGFMPKPGAPDNLFNVSMLPWESFEGFNLNLQKGYDYLLPIFTMGRYYEDNERIFLPLAVQVHHAVCDGFHVCRFVAELREMVRTLETAVREIERKTP